MARIMGLWFVFLLFLGCMLGGLTFLCWDSKRQLYQMQKNYHAAQKRMSQSVSEARLIQYNSSLMELDLEIFKKGKKENQATISALQKQLDGAKIQMELSDKECKELKENRDRDMSEKNEMLGIEETLAADVQSCKEKLEKCEKGKSSSVRSATATASRKVKDLEVAKKMLSGEVEKGKEKIRQLSQDIALCKSSPL